MEPVRIYGFPVSTWTRTACMTCREKGVDYELVPIAYGSEDHAALHPFRRIPVLEHGDVTISEGLAITQYVDEAFAGPALQPEGLAQRTRMRQWLSICADYVFRDVVRKIPRGRPPTDDELTSARSVLESIDALVGQGPYLVGAHICLADLYLAPQISNCKEKAPELLDSLRALSAWMDGIAGRDSFTATAYDPAGV